MLMKPAGVAAALNVSTKTVLREIADGKIATILVRGRHRIAPDALQAYLAAQCQSAKKATGGRSASAFAASVLNAVCPQAQPDKTPSSTKRRRVATWVDDALGRRQPTVEEILDRWEPDAKRMKSWDRDLKYRTDVLRRGYGMRSTAELPEIVADLKQRILGAGKSPAAANRYLAILRRASKLAGGTAKIAFTSGETSRSFVLTAANVRTLLAASDVRLRPMIEFSLLTGMRKAEQLALTPESIRDGCAVLPDTKAGRPRVIPLPPRALEIARRHLPWSLQRDNVRRLFDAARAAAGLPDVRWHDLRRTYGSMLVSAGAPLHAVRDLLGHADISTTSVYLATVRPDLEKAVALLPMGKARGRKKAKAR